MPVPYTFGASTSAIPLSNLDSNFATTITLGNTAIQLGNTVTTLNNMTLANVTISSGTVSITNVTVTTANVTTLNVATSIVTTSETLNYGTANGVLYLNASKVATSGSALTFDGNNMTQSGPNAAVTLQVNTANAGVSASNYSEIALSDVGAVRTYWRSLRDGSGATIFSGNDHIRYALLGTEQMRLTSTGLGIGTSSVTAIYGTKTVQLQSSGGATNYVTTGTHNALLAATTDGIAHIGTSTAATVISIENANGTALTIDAARNLGLGVTPSAWGTFTAAQIGATASLAAFTGQTVVGSNWYYNSGDKYLTTDYASVYSQSLGQHRWYTAPSGTAGNAITFTQAMTLDASGKLSINNTSATGYITVDTKAQSGLDIYRSDSSAQYSGIRFRDTTNANNYGLLGWDSGGLRLDGVAGTIYFSTSGSERARITSGGDLLVGTTSSAAKLTVEGAAIVAKFSRTTAGGLAEFKNSDDAGYGIEFRNAANGSAGTIYWTATTTTYATSSDARLKENIADADSASSLIDAIKVRKFDWKDGGSHQRYGFVAQELLPVAPEAVSVPADDPDGLMGVDYSKLVPMLIKEIQSLRARVAALEAA